MTMPVDPPFAVKAAYQDRQYGHGSIYTPAIPSVFYALVNPPTSGVAAETASEEEGEAVGFTPYGPYQITFGGTLAGAKQALITATNNLTGYTSTYGLAGVEPEVSITEVTAGAAAANGNPAINEVQELVLTNSPIGGTFKLTFGADTTTALAYNATAAQIQSALQALGTVGSGNVTVTGTGSYLPGSENATVLVLGVPTGGTFNLGFGGDVATGIPYNASAAQVQSALSALQSIPLTSAGTDEVQTVTISGAPTAGTFTLSYGGQTTAALEFNSTAAEVQTALGALSTIGAANISVTSTNAGGGTAAGGPYVVTFIGSLGDSSTITAITGTSSLTGGTSPTVTAAVTTAGAGPTYSVSVATATSAQITAALPGGYNTTGVTGYIVSFTGALTDVPLAPLVGDGTDLTGGTSPLIQVTINTVGQAAWVNNALEDATRQHDAMRDFYDAASGNNFGQPAGVGWDGPSNNIYWENQPSLNG